MDDGVLPQTYRGAAVVVTELDRVSLLEEISGVSGT